MVHQPEMIRGRIAMFLKGMRIHLANFPIPETEAIDALRGPEGQRNFEDIVNFIMERLGHAPSARSKATTARMAREHVPPRPEPPPKPKPPVKITKITQKRDPEPAAPAVPTDPTPPAAAESH